MTASRGQADLARELYRTMLRIRRFEEAASRLFAEAKLPGFLHVCLGQEAVAAGACAALRPDDVIATTHRGHGHCIAKGADQRRMMAELFGRREGYCRGLAGSMHIADLEHGILGANGIVGGGIPIATGAAYALQVQKSDRIVVGFFGEGAANEGVFHEALNLAALWRLPILYLCENNGYAEMTPEPVHRAGPGIAARGAAYGVAGEAMDGADPLAVCEAVGRAAEACRAGRGPALLEVRTNRWHGHFEGDPQRYRPAADLEAARRVDPIPLLADRMQAAGWADAAWIEAARARAEAELSEAIAYGANGTPADYEEMLARVYCGDEGEVR